MRTVCATLLLAGFAGAAAAGSPALRTATWRADDVIVVPVRAGTATQVNLPDDDVVMSAGAGVGADCARATDSWCIAVEPGLATLFVKPRSFADSDNNLVVAGRARHYALRFALLAGADPRLPVYRLDIVLPKTAATPAPAAPSADVLRQAIARELAAPDTARPAPAATLAARLARPAAVRNTRYTVAVGDGAAGLVPALVYDDGRFTYLRYPANRELPAAFLVRPDGSEEVLNQGMGSDPDGAERDLLVLHKVMPQFRLRLGTAVVTVFNEAFDAEGLPPEHGTSAPGVARVFRTPPSQAPR